MINHVSVKYNPSFKAVVPVDVTFNNPEGVEESNVSSKNPTKNEALLERKAIHSLVNILTKNDENESSIAKEAENTMIRTLMSLYTKDYKIPESQIDKETEPLIRTVHRDDLTYILTGQEARLYADATKKIGQAINKDKDSYSDRIQNYNRYGGKRPKRTRSNENTQRSKVRKLVDRMLYEDMLTVSSKGKRQPATLYLYADVQPRKRKATLVDVKSVDFKKTGSNPDTFR